MDGLLAGTRSRRFGARPGPAAGLGRIHALGMLLVAAGLLAAAVASPSSAVAAERSTADRPDDYPGPRQVHVMYVVPSDGADRSLDTDGTLAASVTSWQDWLRGQTGGPGLVLDNVAGQLDVTFARLPSSGAELEAEGDFILARIERELRSLGRLTRGKLYAVHYDGSANSCGSGPWPQSAEEIASRGQQVAAIYLLGPCEDEPFAGPGQAAGYRDLGMLHELIHGLGIVPKCAPNHTLAGHVSDSPSDLMYAGAEPWEPSVLDAGRDDYYGTGRGDCPDLAESFFLEGQKPPKTKKKRGPSGTIKRRGATFRFSSPNAAGFECKLDTGKYRRCTSPARVRQLRKGRHRFYCRAISEAGLPDPTPAVWRFRVRRGAR